MTFEQHPELFFALVALIGAAGGWAGATLRHLWRSRRRWSQN